MVGEDVFSAILKLVFLEKKLVIEVMWQIDSWDSLRA